MARGILVRHVGSLGDATTIFIPKLGDVDVPVGGFIIFSGSKAHAGMGLGFGGFCVQVSHSHTLVLQGRDTQSVIADYIFIFSAQILGSEALHLWTTWMITEVLSQL